MPFDNRAAGHKMSRCISCDADLVAKKDGKLACSNPKCRLRKEHASLPYATFKGATP
jgi:hypothetical protein